MLSLDQHTKSLSLDNGQNPHISPQIELKTFSAKYSVFIQSPLNTTHCGEPVNQKDKDELFESDGVKCDTKALAGQLDHHMTEAGAGPDLFLLFQSSCFLVSFLYKISVNL